MHSATFLRSGANSLKLHRKLNRVRGLWINCQSVIHLINESYFQVEWFPIQNRSLQPGNQLQLMCLILATPELNTSQRTKELKGLHQNQVISLS